MSDLRHDPIQKRWVIIAEERESRELRQADIRPELVLPASPDCPFCDGQEAQTPPEVYAEREKGEANTPSWDLRVVPNKYPALGIEGEHGREGLGVYDRMNGIGAHEVLIETPRHVLHMADMCSDRMNRIFTAYRTRLNDLKEDPRFKYVLIFKNYGIEAGATIAHPHTQIIATPVTPLTVADELLSARQHFQLKERCLFCDVLSQEMASGERIVHLSEHFVSLCPYASRFPYEVMVLPRKHAHDYGQATDEQVRDLADHMRAVLAKLRNALGDTAFNFLFHTAPNTKHSKRRSSYWDTIEHDWHYHIEILPRLTQTAGFEWGTGFYINPVSPESAAEALRKAGA
jgi:UDPglucose--hexose-1-phosphate uridylyltransferase